MGSNIAALWRERNMHQGRANRAEDAGFDGTAAEARAEAEEVERRIEKEGPEPWSTAHP